MIKIGILEDHPLFISGIESIVKPEPLLSLCFAGTEAIYLFEYLKKDTLDVLLLDINLPEVNGFDVLKVLTRKYPSIKVCILTSYQDRNVITRAIKLGALGYLSKVSSKIEILEAINKINRNIRYVEKRLRDKVVATDILKSKNIVISEREENVLRLICKEKSTKEIAEILNISVNTVSNHRKSILSKTGVDNMVGLLKYGFQYGYLD